MSIHLNRFIKNMLVKEHLQEGILKDLNKARNQTKYDRKSKNPNVSKTLFGDNLLKYSMAGSAVGAGAAAYTIGHKTGHMNAALAGNVVGAVAGLAAGGVAHLAKRANQTYKQFKLNKKLDAHTKFQKDKNKQDKISARFAKHSLAVNDNKPPQSTKNQIVLFHSKKEVKRPMDPEIHENLVRDFIAEIKNKNT